MVKQTNLDAIRIHRSDPDAIVAAGELSVMRFMAGNALCLGAAKLFCVLIQEAGIAVADQVQRRVAHAVLNEPFYLSRDELVEAVMELHSIVVSVHLVIRQGAHIPRAG